MSHLIFVYGTLKQGHGNHRLIHDQKFKGIGVSEENFQMYSLGGFPGVVAGSKEIVGELYEVDDLAFERCDRLEGHPHFYKREQVQVMNEEFEDVLAWIYIYQGKTEGLEAVDEWK